jgi:hypothetical protein
MNGSMAKKSQIQKFRELARALECNESEAAFDRAPRPHSAGTFDTSGLALPRETQLDEDAPIWRMFLKSMVSNGKIARGARACPRRRLNSENRMD